MEQVQDDPILLSRGPVSPLPRYVVYAMYLALLLVLIGHLCTSYRGGVRRSFFEDNEIVENIQIFNIFLGAIIVLWSARILFAERDPLVWPVLCVAIGLLWATNRELDRFWEDRNLESTYKFFQFFFGFAGASLLVLRFSVCWREYKKWALSLPMLFFYCVVALWIVAEVSGGILDEVSLADMTRQESRAFKRIVEETIEMFSTSFVLFGAIEMLLVVRSRRSHETDNAGRRA